MSQDSEPLFKTGIDKERDKAFSKISVPNVEDSDDFYYGAFPRALNGDVLLLLTKLREVGMLMVKIDDGSNGDVACDSYNRFREDVQLLKNMGANMYRFSLSWPRILPTGDPNNVNENGVQYYRDLIDELWANGIEPIVTIYHWDMPQVIADKYTWLDEEIVEKFVDYCRIVFERFGDKVNYYVTINEPWAIAAGGFDLGIFPPYKVGTVQKGKLGLSLDTWWNEPADPNSQEDIEAANRAMEFKLGIGAYPLLHGCYPPSMRERIDKNSAAEGRDTSRLPTFSDEWKNKIKGAYDFFGLNHYSSQLVTTPARAPKACPEIRWSIGKPGFDTDQDIFQYHDPTWPSTTTWWCKFVPWGFRKTLNYIKNEYGNPEVLVTENGCSGERSELQDTERTNFFRGYINDMLKAIAVDGCKVIGYSAWSLLDGWEWGAGNTVTFGIHHVDLEDPLKTRTPRDSAKFLGNIFKNNGFVKG
ncbi:unnamed protein product [Allacma fusca]|uniref:Beta-glucosidase n=1 Tax=Allacma fusca TaxID=39272 RepID=A0A8J2Q2S6_9HEXA|nr:unnamed protein product [Allacma fusca]